MRIKLLYYECNEEKDYCGKNGRAIYNIGKILFKD